jgi:hypothetical protein
LENNPTFHARMKNVNVQYHFFHDMVDDAKVSLEKEETLENVIDTLMKPMSTSLMGLRAYDIQ